MCKTGSVVRNLCLPTLLAVFFISEALRHDQNELLLIRSNYMFKSTLHCNSDGATHEYLGIYHKLVHVS